MDSEIGEAAGRVWQCLHDNGEMKHSDITKETGLKRDVTLSAVGWLAREAKLCFRKEKRSTYISLV